MKRAKQIARAVTPRQAFARWVKANPASLADFVAANRRVLQKIRALGSRAS